MIETGLIIAAGQGSRLADESEIPKPLRKVAGLPLLERTIKTCIRAGLNKLYIVVGFDKEKIISFIENRSWPIEITSIENPDWQKSNGLSVLAAKDHIKENFILMMSDHVFDKRILEGLCSDPMNELVVKLAVDYKLQQIFDMDDATKVLMENGLMNLNGKHQVLIHILMMTNNKLFYEVHIKVILFTYFLTQ